VAGIDITGLHFSFGGPAVLKGVDLSIEQGDLITVFGPNGAGKTTLLKILAGLLRPAKGTVLIAGVDAARSPTSLRRLIGMISHQPYVYPQLTGRENLEFYAGLYGLVDPRRKAKQMLEQMQLQTAADTEVGTYSRGMQQRLAVARALLHDPRVLLLDEPFTGLDQQGREHLSGLLRDLRSGERTIVMTTHDIDEGLGLSDRLAVLARGRVALETSAAGLDHASFQALYREAVTREQPAPPGRGRGGAPSTGASRGSEPPGGPA
jgi:heme exporter protein A